MPTRFDLVSGRRRIIDRRAAAADILELDRDQAAARLKSILGQGRDEIARRLEERPYAGTEAAASYAYLTDQLLRLVHDYVVERLHPVANPTASERLLLLAIGGYGRG